MRYALNLLALFALLFAMTLPAYAGGRRGGRGGGMFGDFPNKKPVVGDKAPDFELEDTKGKKYKLSKFKGKKPIVIEFGALT